MTDYVTVRHAELHHAIWHFFTTKD